MGIYISGISKETFETLIGRALFEGLEPNLIEVKTPHGRLIDEDIFAKAIVKSGFGAEFIYRVTDILINTPAVIEAEAE